MTKPAVKIVYSIPLLALLFWAIYAFAQDTNGENLELGDVEALAEIKLKINIIREKDPEFKSDSLWQKAIADLENFTKDRKETLAVGEGLYILGRVKEKLFAYRKSKDIARESVDVYVDLFSAYPSHPKADDALFHYACLLYTSPSPRDATLSRMPSSA